MNLLLDYIDEVSSVPEPEEIVYEHDKAHPNFKKLVEMTSIETMEANEDEHFPWEKVKLDLELKLKTGYEYSGQVNSEGEPHGFGCQSKGPATG